MDELAGRFALRVGNGRGGAAIARRGDDLHPPTYAARVRPARGQALLPMFGLHPPRRRQPPGPPAPSGDGHSSNDCGPAGAFLRDVTAGAARRNRTNGFHKQMFFKSVNLPFLRLPRAPGRTMPPVGEEPVSASVWSLRKAPAVGA